MNNIENIDRFVARVLLMSFFLPTRVQVFVAAACCFWFVGRTIVVKEWAPKSNYGWAVFLGSIFIIYVLAVPFTPAEYRKALWHICERGEAQLLMPLVFAIITPAFRKVIRGELIYFVFGCLVSCVISNADFAYHYLHNDSGTHPLSHVLYRMYFEAVSGIHPTYMSMYLAFSVCILLTTDVFNVKGGQIVKYALLYGTMVLLLALLAKSPLIALVMILLHMAWINRKTISQYKTMIVGGTVAVLATGFAVPFFRQRMLEIVQIFTTHSEAGGIANNSLSERKMIFHTDMAILHHYWLTGIGPGRLLPMLQAHYLFQSLQLERFTNSFDPHNQYLAIWLSFGLVGIGLFVAVLAVQFTRAIRSRDNLYLYLLIILTVTFFTESVLYRQWGVVFYAVFTSLFFFGVKSKVESSK